MNSKRAKLLRKVGKLDKMTKRLYNRLSHNEKGLLSTMYTEIIARNEHIVSAPVAPEGDGPSIEDAIEKSMETTY